MTVAHPSTISTGRISSKDNVIQCWVAVSIVQSATPASRITNELHSCDDGMAILIIHSTAIMTTVWISYRIASKDNIRDGGVAIIVIHTTPIMG